MNDYLQGKIESYCYMVKKGKPAAMISIQNRYVKEAIKKVKSLSNLKTIIEDTSKGWKVLWIYKYSHIEKVIKSSRQVPKTTFDHWVLGKLFGYSEEAIADFINRLV